MNHLYMDVCFHFLVHTEFSQILKLCSYIIHLHVSIVLCCTGQARRKEMQVSYFSMTCCSWNSNWKAHCLNVNVDREACLHKKWGDIT